MKTRTSFFSFASAFLIIASICLSFRAYEPWELAPLVDAIRMGNRQAVEKALKAGVNANSIGPGGNPLLLEAVVAGQVEIVKMLLDRGADPKAKGNETIAVAAVRQGRMDMLKLLLQAGAYINRPEGAPNWDDILVAAARSKNTDMIRYLISRGANPKASGLGDTTALQVAAARGDIETMNALIAAGADINHRELNGMTALMIACQKGQTEAAKLLVAYGADASLSDGYGRGAEWFASHSDASGTQQLRVACAPKSAR